MELLRPLQAALFRVKAALLYEPGPHVSRLFFKHRYFRGAVFLLVNICTTLVYYGWQHFSTMLFRAGAYDWLCKGGSHNTCNDDDPLGFAEYRCCEQYKAVQVMFTVGLSCEFIMSVVAGVCLDYLGPLLTAFGGNAMLLVGWLCLIYSNERFPMHIPAMVFLAGSVNMIAFPTLVLGDLFPSRSGLAVSLVVAAQTGATAVPIMLEKIWSANPSWAFSGVAWMYLGCFHLPCFLLSMVCLPARRVIREDGPISPAGSTAASAVLDDGRVDEAVTTGVKAADDIELVRKGSHLDARKVRGLTAVDLISLEGVACEGDVMMAQGGPPQVGISASTVYRPSIWRQICSVEYIVFTAYYILQLLQFGYYPTTVKAQYGKGVSDFQGYVLPTQALFGALFGLVVDRTTTLPICAVLISMMSLAYVFALVRSIPLQYLTTVLYAVSNAYIYTVKYTYVAEVFPSAHFGILIGLMGCISGAVALVNIPIQNRNNYRETCVAYVVVGCVAYGLVGLLYWRKKKGIHYRRDVAQPLPKAEKKATVWGDCASEYRVS